jgi:hypothetical protein
MTQAPFCLDSSAGVRERMKYTLWDELREIAWLASVVGALSVVGVGLAVALAAAAA